MPEDDIVGEERASYDAAIRNVETAISNCGGTIKSVRKEIVTRLRKFTFLINVQLKH